MKSRSIKFCPLYLDNHVFKKVVIGFISKLTFSRQCSPFIILVFPFLTLARTTIINLLVIDFSSFTFESLKKLFFLTMFNAIKCFDKSQE